MSEKEEPPIHFARPQRLASRRELVLSLCGIPAAKGIRILGQPEKLVAREPGICPDCLQGYDPEAYDRALRAG